MRSAAMRRFKLRDAENPWFTKFSCMTRSASGLGYERGIVRRDPSCIIQVDGLYFVWYTRGAHPCPAVGHERATDVIPAMPWDLTDVWYATSTDGRTWREQGPAVERGPAGSYDERSIFTPDVLAHDGRYYLVYQVTNSSADLAQHAGINRLGLGRFAASTGTLDEDAGACGRTGSIGRG